MEVRALKAGNGELILEVLGAPYGGPYRGKDSHGDYFDAKTNVREERFPQVPIIYAHGFNPKTRKPEDVPAYIGTAKYARKDDKGHWYTAVLDKTNEVARKMWEGALSGFVKASSGAINHLVRRAKDGRLIEWPIVELTLVDTREGINPANPYAIAFPMLKMDYELAGMKLEGVSGDEAQSGNSTEQTTEQNNKGGTMDEKETKVENELAPTVTDLQEGIQEILEQKQEARKAQEKKQAAKANIVSTLAQYIDETMTEAMKAAPAENKAGSAHLNLKTKRGDDAMKAFVHFLNSGDAGGIRTGEAYDHAMKTDYHLVTGTQYQGQEVVPTEVYTGIVERRNTISIARKANAMIVPAKAGAINIPIEKANPQKFGIVTIDGSNAFTTLTQQPLDKLAGTVYDFTYNVPISSNLQDDDVAGVDAWIPRYVGRGLGLTENQYLLMGTGSGQPQGAVYASAKGVDLDTVGITAAEVLELYFSLAAEYRSGAAWVMAGATEGTIRGTAISTTFPFVGTGGTYGGVGNSGLTQGAGWMVDPSTPVFSSDEIDAIAASKKVLCIGNFNAGYAIIDRRYMTILRDPYSEASKGLVNLWFHARFSGGIVDALAFKHASTPTG